LILFGNRFCLLKILMMPYPRTTTSILFPTMTGSTGGSTVRLMRSSGRGSVIITRSCNRNRAKCHRSIRTCIYQARPRRTQRSSGTKREKQLSRWFFSRKFRKRRKIDLKKPLMLFRRAGNSLPLKTFIRRWLNIMWLRKPQVHRRGTNKRRN